MSEVPETRIEGDRCTHVYREEDGEGALERPKDLKLNCAGAPFNGIDVEPDEARKGVYKNGRRMAHFVPLADPEEVVMKMPDGSEARALLHATPLLRWDAHTSLAFLQGASVPFLLGERFSIIEGSHRAAWRFPPGVEDAVLAEITSCPEDVSPLSLLAQMATMVRAPKA